MQYYSVLGPLAQKSAPKARFFASFSSFISDIAKQCLGAQVYSSLLLDEPSLPQPPSPYAVPENP